MSNTASASVLLTDAANNGSLSGQALQIIKASGLDDQITAALGTPALDVTSSEAILVTLLVDDSGSIRFAGNSQPIRDGHNLVIEALKGSKQGDAIQVQTSYLNRGVLYPYSPIAGVPNMDSKNYDPNGGTPLYDKTLVTLATVAAKTEEFAGAGIPVRGITLILTDGHDEGSKKATAKDVAKIVKSLLAQENHIIAGMGVDDGSGTDFRAIFQEMGIPDEWILTPGKSPSEVRKAFQVFSQSAVRASQAAGTSFSKVAAGGFGTP
jgi:hypothetical protein